MHAVVEEAADEAAGAEVLEVAVEVVDDRAAGVVVDSRLPRDRQVEEAVLVVAIQEAELVQVAVLDLAAEPVVLVAELAELVLAEDVLVVVPVRVALAALVPAVGVPVLVAAALAREALAVLVLVAVVPELARAASAVLAVSVVQELVRVASALEELVFVAALEFVPARRSLEAQRWELLRSPFARTVATSGILIRA